MSLVDKDHWHNSGMFLLFDHDGAGSTVDSAAVSLVIKDNWFRCSTTRTAFPESTTSNGITRLLHMIRIRRNSQHTGWCSTHRLIGRSNLAGRPDRIELHGRQRIQHRPWGWNKHAGISGPPTPGSTLPQRITRPVPFVQQGAFRNGNLALFNSKL